MNQTQRNIREFRERFGLPVGDKPALLTQDEYRLHVSLLEEELAELKDAILDADLQGVYDALLDIEYVLYGLAEHSGLDMQKGHREVHASNMSKLDSNGEPLYNSTGKVVKGPNFWPPRLDVVLEEQGYEG